MNLDLNHLIEHYANTIFRVQGVYHYIIEPGQNGTQQSAPFAGFIFPIAGKSQYHFNGTPYLSCVGNVVHGGANMRLDKRVIGPMPWEFICVLYETVAEPEAFCLSKLHFDLATGQSPQLTKLLWRLWESSNQPGAMQAFRVDTLFRRVLEDVFDCARNRNSSAAQALFEKVTAYIHEHYREPLVVRDLAEASGVNENRLFYVCQKYVGMGAGDYLLGYRLNRAKELLVTTDLPVGQISQNVGYPDALYFSRMFKKRFGIPPSRFREI